MTYIIVDAGSTHNGDLDLAFKLIDMAAMPVYEYDAENPMPGVDAIKFTKRDMSEELSRDEFNRLYPGKHSYGQTYGSHRERLELSYDNFKSLEFYTHSKGLDFVITLCSPKTVKLVEMCQIDRIKVASRDLNHIPLLEEIGKTKIPVILSTGMSDMEEIDNAINVITKYHDNLSILHCLSQYPADYNKINLNSIAFLKKMFEDYKIGYSDHTIGIMVPPVAVALGAEIIEKHITLNRNMKGSDHLGALEPDGLWRMVRDIRNVEKSLGKHGVYVPNEVKKYKVKLGRSLSINKGIKKGEEFTEDMFCMVSPGNGLSWDDRPTGKAKRDIKSYTLLDSSCI
jgi:sialic acid synthase